MKKSALLIWSLIIVDLLSGLFQILQLPFYRVGLILKGIIILYLFFSHLIHLRQKSFRSIYVALVILFTFWLIGFGISFFYYPQFDPGDSIVVLNRYFFFLILACAFLEWSEQYYFEFECKRIFETFLVINNAFIFIGFVFSIDMLSTYDPYGEYEAGWRFGYKGLIFGQNAVAAIYTLGMAYLFRENFRYHHKKIPLLIVTCIASVFVGTKATWLTMILIGGYYLYSYRIKTLIIFILPTFAGLIYIIALYWSSFKEKYLQFLLEKYETMDFYTFWTSNRNGLLVNTYDHIVRDWKSLNYLTGDATSYVEMDFFDLYFFFGISSVLYLFIYFKFFFIKDKSSDNKYFFFVFMLMAFIAGHIINSAIVPLFFLLYVFSAETKQDLATSER